MSKNARKLVHKLKNILLDIEMYEQYIKQVATESSDYIDVHQKIYHFVFSENISKKAFALFAETGHNLSYYDPDADYEDDWRAFYNALNAQLNDFIYKNITKIF